ncbi:hypothetical protein SGPA1_20927 [Streptomyces misionensis JCM 4497]
MPEVFREPADRPVGQPQIDIALGVEVDDLTLGGAHRLSLTAARHGLSQVRPGRQLRERARGQRHGPIMTRSPRRNQRVNKH